MKKVFLCTDIGKTRITARATIKHTHILTAEFTNSEFVYQIPGGSISGPITATFGHQFVSEATASAFNSLGQK